MRRVGQAVYVDEYDFSSVRIAFSNAHSTADTNRSCITMYLNQGPGVANVAEADLMTQAPTLHTLLCECVQYFPASQIRATQLPSRFPPTTVTLTVVHRLLSLVVTYAYAVELANLLINFHAVCDAARTAVLDSRWRLCPCVWEGKGVLAVFCPLYASCIFPRC
jgi:hypothetical protein